MKRVLVSFAIAFLSGFVSLAQVPGISGGVGFDYLFDNNEFAPSANAYYKSSTIQYVRATPRLTISMESADSSTTHSLVAGVDLFHNMGDNPYTPKDLWGETPLYYNVVSQRMKGVFRSSVGIYPRSELKGYYSNIVVSEYLRVLDFYLEGACLSWKNNSFYGELALDWMGAYAQSRKERFQILSSGNWAMSGPVELGWCASMYHYAGSIEAPGVAEIITGIPYIKMTAPSNRILDKLSLQVGLVYSYQRDRVRDHQWKEANPGGTNSPYLQNIVAPELTLFMQKGTFSWTQISHYGKDLLPFYELTDTAGNPYGRNLYRGSNMYRGGLYSVAEIYWHPHINSWVDFRLGMKYHFGSDGYRGCQQIALLRIKLDKLYEKKY